MSRTPIAEKEIVVTRVLNAPRELVWKAWTEAEHFSQWFGPHTFTIPVCELDPRPGGKLLIHMQGPDGNVHQMLSTFLEVKKPERLSFEMTVPDAEGQAIISGTTVATFEERDGKTVLTVTSTGISYQEIGKFMLEGMQEGWTQTVERLEAHLAQL